MEQFIFCVVWADGGSLVFDGFICKKLFRKIIFYISQFLILLNVNDTVFP